MMKKIFGLTMVLFAISSATFAQENEGNSKKITVPAVVKDACMKKYPDSKTHHVTWEKENGNYEANWGGKDGEANSVTYTPSGVFVEIVQEMEMKDLPTAIQSYVKAHYKNAKFGDVGKVLDAQGKTSYELEINRKDVIFDDKGNFVKEEK